MTSMLADARPPCDSCVTKFGGMIRPARALPVRTCSSTCSRFSASIRSTDVKSLSVYVLMSIVLLPSLIFCWLGGILLRNARLGFSGPLDSAKPMSSAIATG